MTEMTVLFRALRCQKRSYYTHIERDQERERENVCIRERERERERKKEQTCTARAWVALDHLRCPKHQVKAKSCRSRHMTKLEQSTFPWISMEWAHLMTLLACLPGRSAGLVGLIGPHTLTACLVLV